MKILAACCFVLMLLVSPVFAQDDSQKPFIFPVAQPSSPSTWIMGQPYGNTTGAFVSGPSSYSAGQYVHFGIDVSMPCGTEVVAIADGVVDSVDNSSRGSAPHNVLLDFPNQGLTVLYGHLLERSTLIPDQPIRQGDVVGLSGSPDSDCNSRPHLHLEVRSLDHRNAYNPVNVIQAPWHSLVGLGVQSRSPFQMDLNAPRRWMSLEDQPDVQFGGSRLNAYQQTLPLPGMRGASAPTLPYQPFNPPPEEWQLRQLGAGGCCFGAWWHDNQHLHVIDGNAGQLASVYEINADGNLPPLALYPAPPPVYSADGTHELRYMDDRTIIQRVSDGVEWHVIMSGAYPLLSPDNQRFVWVQNGREVWGGTLNSGETQLIWRAEDNISARWLDDTRLLISQRDDRRSTSLVILNVLDGSRDELGTWYNLRSMNIAPGGKHLIFFSLFNPDPNLDGAFMLETAPNATPQKLSWFADYRWRDSESLFYITFDPRTDIQQLHFYHVLTGESRALTNPETMPFTIANGDWSVSPDGNRIVFQEVRDDNLWILETPINTGG